MLAVKNPVPCWPSECVFESRDVRHTDPVKTVRYESCPRAGQFSLQRFAFDGIASYYGLIKA